MPDRIALNRRPVLDALDDISHARTILDAATFILENDESVRSLGQSKSLSVLLAIHSCIDELLVAATERLEPARQQATISVCPAA